MQDWSIDSSENCANIVFLPGEIFGNIYILFQAKIFFLSDEISFKFIVDDP